MCWRTPALRLDSKEDFAGKANLEELAGRLKALGLTVIVLEDEMHGAYKLSFQESTEGEHFIDLELSAQPEYRRLRSLSKQIADFNKPPFKVFVKDTEEEVADCMALLEYIKAAGMKGASVQRYKGLGEMNAEQLWDTTMNPETRRLLQVRIDDAVATEEIFSTLMGESVEARRKFIGENALNVKNLDI